MVSCQMTNYEDVNLYMEGDGSTQTLRIELVSTLTNVNHALGDRIRAFDEEQRNIDVHLVSNNDIYSNLSPWVIGLEGRGTPPDMIETTYNQIQNMYHHGKIEPLYINDPDLQDYVIKASDGEVIGIKAKVNPLLVYYNEYIFDAMGIEKPAGDWDWAMLDNTIEALKNAGHKAHIMLSPFTLEWLTMNRYDGRISAPDHLRFGGYLDSEAAVRAAEWFAWVGTKKEDFRYPRQHPFPMPHVMIDDQAAIAIDYAYRFFNDYNYERIIEHNDQVNIAPLLGGPDTVNIAQMTGFAILSSSPNKDAAMKLLRYLMEESENYVHDIALYSMQAWAGLKVADEINPERYSIVVREIERSVPASLFMADDHTAGFNINALYPYLKEIIDGGSAPEALKKYADEVDSEFSIFWEYPDAYGECIRGGRKFCVH